MKPKIILFGLCALAAAAALSAVALSRLHHPPIRTSTAPRTFEVLGRIRSVDVPNKLVRITHQAIPGYMPAMTMPFTVKDPGLLSGLVPGDPVQFELAVTTEDSWITHLEKIAPDQAREVATPADATASLAERETERLQTGELVPDFKLTDQDSRTFRLSDFRGKAVVLTFIYTRCPLPNFCPLMSKNFAELEHRLAKEFEGRFQLLSLSMDPDFDQPAVLKEYAARYGANEKDWSFATGDAEQIKFVAGLMGLYYVREGGLISHDLRTALIGPDGRLIQLWKSNVWTPYEVQRLVRETLTGNKDIAAR